MNRICRMSNATKKRNELARPIMLSFEKWMEETYPTVLPKNRMGEAISYSYSLWPRMKNYLKDGRLKIDNNLAENALRPIALSRKKTSCSVVTTKQLKIQQ